MTKGRKTTFEERIEIVQYCIAHNHNYAETAEKYQVSYQQARSYTVKYEAGGIDALKDNRGKRKNPDELSELERLRTEVKLLKAQKERVEMEVSFLKKLEEIHNGSPDKGYRRIRDELERYHGIDVNDKRFCASVGNLI